MPSISRRGYIYFILDQSANAIKIGFSTNVQERLSTLRTASATSLILLGSMPGTMAQELRLHQQFQDSRLEREWFRVTTELWQFIGTHANPTEAYQGYMPMSIQRNQPIPSQSELKTETTLKNDIHHGASILIMIILVVVGFSFWRMVIIEPILMQVGLPSLINPFSYFYGAVCLWALTHRYRNDRKVVQRPELTAHGRGGDAALKGK